MPAPVVQTQPDTMPAEQSVPEMQIPAPHEEPVIALEALQTPPAGVPVEHAPVHDEARPAPPLASGEVVGADTAASHSQPISASNTFAPAPAPILTPTSAPASSSIPASAPASSSKSNLFIILAVLLALGGIIGLAFVASTYFQLGSITKAPCASNVFTTSGACCAYVCPNVACPSGYKSGTCNCECIASLAAPTPKPALAPNQAAAPSTASPPAGSSLKPANPGVADIFAEPAGVSPPPLPK